jgi:hypothetical protein
MGCIQASVRRYDDALPPELFEDLSGLVLELYQTEDPKGTFWQPVRSGSETCVSAAAATLSRLLPSATDCVGVEWWARVRPAGQAMAIHNDKDESLFRETGVLSHPRYSGVLYLLDEGGPTVVLASAAMEQGPARSGSTALLSHPSRNGFLAFPGRLAHGVARALPESGGRRASLLMNWWPARPSAPACQDPPSNTLHPYARTHADHSPRPGRLAETTFSKLADFLG